MVNEAYVQEQAPVGADGAPPSEPASSGADERFAALEATVARQQQELEARDQREREQAQQNRAIVEQQMLTMIAGRPETERPALMHRFEQWKLKNDREALAEERKRLEAERGEVFGLSRAAYVERVATRDGIDANALQERVMKWNITDPVEVDRIAADLKAAGSGTPRKAAIAGQRTDSGVGQGTSGESYSDILRGIRDRQMKGENIRNPVVEARRLAVSRGVPIP